MGFIKKSSTSMPIQPLNVPTGGVWGMLNTEPLQKQASMLKDKPVDLNGFDLQAAVDENPDHLFVKVFAIKQNEVNDNGDAFSKEELMKAAHTFVGCPVFVNHQNDDVEKARGKVVHAWYDESSEGIYCVNMVDKTAYPQLARGIEEGYIVGTSMGAQVGHSVCSICHNKAHTADEFCSHIKNQKTRKFSGKVKNAYHDSPSKPTTPDPITGKKLGEEEMLEHKEAKVFEWNYDINFIEDSFVVNPACHDCLVCDILNVPAVESKLASKVEELQKVASSFETKMASGKIEKTAGKLEVEALNEAMNLLEKVTRSIMAQKQQVDMEYASDLIEVLAKVQGTTDELIEMGYTQLPSPSESEVMFGNNSDASPVDGGGAEQMSDPAMLQQPAQAMPGGVETGNLGNEVGTVTRPTFSSSNATSREEFFKEADKIRDNLHKIRSGLDWAQTLLEHRRKSVTSPDRIYEARNGDRRVTIAHNEDGETYVGRWNDTNLVGWSSEDEFNAEMRMLMANDPQKAAETILSGHEKESGSMSNQNKTAAGNGVTPEQAEVITQKQLDNADLPLHGRTEESYTTITEGSEQIGGEERVNDTTTDSPQTRWGTYEFITQAQLEEISDGYLARWDSFPEVITEKQWDEMSREVSANLPDDYTDQIGQAQLISLREDHRWVDPNVITQGQLDDQGGTMPHAGDSSRWKAASTFDPQTLVRTATSAVSDAIANYGLSPNDLRKAVTALTNTPQSHLKAAYLTLVNAMPSKVEDRRDARVRSSYFSRIASSGSNVKPIDGLLGAMGDNLGYSKAEDFVDAIKFVVNDNKVLASAEREAQQKLASTNVEETVVDKFAQFSQAFETISSDGIFKVCGTISEDLEGVDAKDAPAFFARALPYVQAQTGESDVIIANADIDDEAGTFEIVAKTVAVADENELKAFASLSEDNFKAASWGEEEEDEDQTGDDEEYWEDSAKEQAADEAAMQATAQTRTAARKQKLEKTAQMMGGQMPTGLGDGMGGGASLPTPPDAAGGAAPVESLDAGDPLAEETDLADGDLDPSPPGSKCPVCGSEDVDILGGKGKCNNCGSEFVFKVDIEVTKWADLTPEDGPEGDDDDMGLEGEGFAVEDEGFDQDIPVAAYTRITNHALEKIAESKIALGSVSPYTGSTDTVALGEGERFCLNTGRRYRLSQAMKGDSLFVQWEWTPPVANSCPSCNRLKKTFASALGQFGMSDEDFEKLSLEDRGKVILSMNNKGLLNRVKTASSGSVLGEYKKAHSFGPGVEFPVEQCREVLSRRFGENALALSGPDEGENLVDSVCKRLASANVYSDRIAVKVAEIWSQPDGCIECLEDFIRSGFSAKQASVICDQLKTKYAMGDELFAEELEGPFDDVVDVVDDVVDDVTDGVDLLDSDPFAEDAGDAGFVAVEIPLDVLENFDEAIDEALGKDPGDEGHHDESALPEGEAEIALPADAVDAVDDAADVALDTAVGVADAVEDAVDESPVTETPIDGEADDSEGGEAVDDALGFGGDDDSDDDDDDDGPGGGEYPEGKEEEDGSVVVEGMEAPMTGYAENSAGIKKESSANIANRNEAPSQEQIMRDSDAFKPGKISQSHKVSLDLANVAALLSKQAGEGEVEQANAQDDADIQPTSDAAASQMGHEDKLSLEDPDAPSVGAGATMGAESDDVVPTDHAVVPAGGGEMGHEADQGYTAEKGHEFTGGVDGAGNSKAASVERQVLKTSDVTSNLAERIVSVATQVSEAKPDSDDEDIKPISDNSDHSHTPENSKITPFEESDNVDVPEAGNEARMGHEESLGDVPKAPQHQPDIPEGGGSNEHYDKNERYDAEKQDRIKGTVIARGDAESLTAQRNEAIRVSARMLQSQMISAEQMPAKIAELERYNPEQIQDIERAMFGVVQKGLDTVAQGTEKPLVIAESSNKRDKNSELTGQIQTLFSLHQDNELASEDDIANLRRRR